MADDVASLGIEVDTSQVVIAADVLRSLAARARDGGMSLDELKRRYIAAQQASAAHTQAAQQGVRATQAHTQATQQAARELAGLQRVFTSLAAQFAHNTESLGRLGQFLISFGPIGVALGASIGTLVLGFEALNRAAERLGERSIDLRNFTTITGLSTDQVQALTAAAESLGVRGQVLQTFLDRFTVNLTQAQEAQGPLYDTLLKINPALAQQMVNVKSTAEAFNVLSQAFQQAGTQQNKLLQSAGGRFGMLLAPVMAQSGGGIEGLVHQFEHAITLTDAEIQNLAELTGKLTEIRNQNRELFSKMFAGDVLQGQVQFQENLNGILRNLKSMRTEVDAFVDRHPFLKTFGFMGTPEAPAAGPLKINTRGGVPEIGPSGAEAAQGAAALAKQMKDLNEVLGAGATVQDKMKAKLQELQAAYFNGKFAVVAGKDAQEQYNKAVAGLRAEEANRLIQANVAAMGNAVTITEQYEAKASALKEQLRAGTITQEAYNRAINHLPVDKANELLRENVSALGDAAFASEKYQLQIADLTEKFNQGRITQETFNRAALNLNPVVKELKDSFEELTQGIVAGFLQGKSAAEALTNSLKAVTATAASETVKNLIKGDLSAAAVSGSIAVGSWLLSRLTGGQTAEEKAAEQQAAQAAVEKMQQAGLRAEQNFSRAATALLDTSTRAGALAAQEEQFRVEQANEVRQGGEALTELLRAQGLERIALQRKFDEQEAELAKQAEAERLQTLDNINRQINNAQGKGFLNEFTDLFKTLADAKQRGFDPTLISQLLRTQGQSIVNSAQITSQAFQDLLTTFPALAGAVVQFGNTADQVADRAKTLDDRIFSALTDTSTLQGALADFDRRAQQEREDEIKLGGANIVKLEAAQALERLNIYKQFNDRLLQQVTNLSNTINQFLFNMQTGSQSTLSPVAKLAAAQAQYNTTLAQAQAGNFDAANQITGYASQLLDAARNVYGSTGSYVTLFNQITTQLQALPAQVSAAQHIVDAVNDATDAVGAGNVIAQNQKLVLDTINASTAATVDLANASNLLQTSIKAFTDATASSVAQLVTLNSQTGGVLSLLTDIRSFSVSIKTNTETSAGHLSTLAGTVGAGTTTSTNIHAFVAPEPGTLWPGATGGLVTAGGIHAATGGMIFGRSYGRDSVAAVLQPGEIVIRQAIAARNPWLLGLNRTGSAGFVGGDHAALLGMVIAELRRNSAITAQASENNDQLLAAIVGATNTAARETKFKAAAAA